MSLIFRLMLKDLAIHRKIQSISIELSNEATLLLKGGGAMGYRRPVVLLALLLVVLTIFVSANSGPTFWEVSPSSESLSIEENSPIEVIHETLTFDARDSQSNNYSMTARVTADYKMHNTSHQAHTSQMAFPFVTSYNELSDTIEVTVDGIPVPYIIYSGDPVNAGGNPNVEVSPPEFSFERITDTIMPGYYQSESLSPGSLGTLCTFVVEGGPSDHEVGLTYDDGSSATIFSIGFNGYSINGSHKEASGWQRDGEQASIFVLGELPELRVKVYEDHAGTEEATGYTTSIIYEEMTYKAYFDAYIMPYITDVNKQRDQAPIELIDDLQLYNMITRNAEAYMHEPEGFLPVESVGEALDYERLFTLLYEIPFKNDETRELQVSYDGRASMDSRQLSYEVHTFQYLLNPASHWQSFGGLDLYIYTDDLYPEILESNLELTEDEPGNYHGSYDVLPETDLVFSIKGKELQGLGNITNIDGSRALVYGVMFLVIVLVVVVVAIRRRR